MDNTKRVHPVFFVFKSSELVREIDALPGGAFPLDLVIPRIFDGPFCWIIQTFLHLRSKGHDVRLSDQIVPNQINVLHFDHLALRDNPARAFLAVVRADRPVPCPADVVFVQNETCIEDSRNHFYMPLWPQPGIIPRDPARGTSLKTIAYFGVPAYARSEFYGDSLRQQLEVRGITLSMRHEPRQWGDYSDVDAILAVRSASEYDKNIKPPSKILNAWRAGCIGFVGVESAYRQVGEPGKDFIEVSKPEDLIVECDRLLGNPEHFRNIVESGKASAARFTDEALTARWAELLFTTIQEHYARWASRPLLVRRVMGLVKLPGIVVKNKLEKKKFRVGIRT